MNGWQTKLRAAVLVVAVLCAIGSGVAYAATPTTPVLRDVFVTPRASLATSPTVTVQWSASTDASGHAIVYDVYRDVIPVTGATIISRGLTPVATGVTGTSAIVNAASAETTQSYVWFYAVVARDSLGSKSGVSYNMSPNVHSNRVDPNQVSCQRCHQVHGAYRVPYQTKEACYFCHGSTGASFATGAKSTYNTEASFFDTGTVTAGSKHRNATMTSTRQECTACHTPHRSPFFYDAAGVYQASLSYRRMLRIEYPTNTYTYYSRNDSPQGNAFCFGCHGANSGPIAIVGGASAYADSGGDHNSAGYATAAHGPSTVLSNTTDPNPGIQCTACHNKHASRADKLVDYRSQNTTASQAGGAALCFSCHSNATTDTRLVGTKPYAWNGRDVQAQFALASKHPAVQPTDRLTCTSCHETHTVAKGGSSAWDMSRANDPDNTKLAAPASPTTFCLRCHDGSAPVATLTASAFVPKSVSFSDPASMWNKAGYVSSGHSVATTTPASCGNCHDPHASSFQRLTAWTRPAGATSLNAGSRENTSVGLSREQNLCYQCHGNGTTAYDGVTTRRAADAKDVVSKAALLYGHDPASYLNKHSDTEFESGVSGANRHAECVDCHDPHLAKSINGVATQEGLESTAGPALFGARGVKPNYPASGPMSAPSSYTERYLTGANDDYEAYVCFRCHSSYTLDAYPRTITRSNGTTYTATDLAREFNPSNYSYHNVLGQAVAGQTVFGVVPENQTTTITVTWPLPTENVFVAGYNWNTKLTCTSCHANDANSATQAKGPHGSAARWILDPAYSGDWKNAGLSSGSTNGMAYQNGTSATDIICAKCHDLYGTGGINGWSNTAHSRSAHFVTRTDAKYCTTCHTGVPHGWKRPRLLGYSTDPAPYRTTLRGTGNSISYPLMEVAAVSHSLSNGGVVWACNDCHTDGGRHGDITNGWYLP